MKIDLLNLAVEFDAIHTGRHSRHSVQDRIKPSLFQYDYLNLRALATDVRHLISSVPPRLDRSSALGLDMGCGKSPYRDLIEHQGFTMFTFDINEDSNPDYIGSIENTGLPDENFDLVICTQVLEHLDTPNAALEEIFRILKPGGHLIISVPHVWFYHPHPADYWRFTQQGLLHIVKSSGFEPKNCYLKVGQFYVSFKSLISFYLALLES